MEADGYGNLLCFHAHLLCHLSHNHSFKIIFSVGFIRNIFRIECLNVNNRMSPILVIMALANEKLKEADAK